MITILLPPCLLKNQIQPSKSVYEVDGGILKQESGAPCEPFKFTVFLLPGVAGELLG